MSTRTPVCAVFAFLLTLVCTRAQSREAVEAPDVLFKRGASGYIVAAPATPLEQRVCDRLSEYMTRVLGAETKVASSLDSVPAGGAIVAPRGRIRVLSGRTCACPERGA